MKRRIRQALRTAPLALAVCAPLAAVDDAGAADPPSYSIYCRGKAGMAEILTRPQGVLVERAFLHSNTAYDPDTLAPGQCAWPDRPVAASEPYKLWFRYAYDSKLDSVAVQNNRLSIWRFKPFKDGGELVELPTPADIEAMNKLQQDAYVVEFRVHADEITRTRKSGVKKTTRILRIDSVGIVRQVGQDMRG